jgi:hypothetical protein
MAYINCIRPGTSEANIYPALGHTYEADYGGDLVFSMEFHSINLMTFVGLKGGFKGFSETVEISVTPLRLQVFMVAWQERNQTSVVHIEDFEKGIVYSNITFPGNLFVRLKGPFKQIN